MYKDMIALANIALKKSKKKFTEDEIQFIVFYAYKVGDMKRVRQLIKEMEGAKESGELDDIYARYNKEMNLKGGVEHVAERMLVNIERYRLEQDNAIGYLVATLHLNGIGISEKEIRNTDMLEMKDKIAKVVAR